LERNPRHLFQRQQRSGDHQARSGRQAPGHGLAQERCGKYERKGQAQSVDGATCETGPSWSARK
jgi:hypothetical protein